MSFAHTFSGGICIHCQAGWGSPAHVASPDECPVLRRATEALNARLAEVAPPARAAAAPQQHITSVLLNLASFVRGGTGRVAVCTCGWQGGQRDTMELATRDALQHEAIPGADPGTASGSWIPWLPLGGP